MKLKNPTLSVRRLSAFAILCTGLFLSTAAAAENSRVSVVVASIKPLELIARELLGEELTQQIQLKTLLQGQASPHHFAMSVTHASLLAEADVLLWVGPEFELFLAKAARGKHSVNFTGLGANKYAGHVRGEHSTDLHLWLNIDLVRQVSHRLIQQLALVRPELTEILSRRQQRFEKQLDTLDSSLNKTLADMEGVPFVAYHQAFGPLVEHYQLFQLASLTEVPDEQISARRVAQFMQQVQGKAKCIVSEVGEAAQAQRYARLLKLPLVSVDLLASQMKVHTYSDYMQLMANQMTRCAGL